jgi:DNA-binding MarR family transcriptional regulator
MGAIEEVGEPSTVGTDKGLPLDAVLEFMRLLWAVDHRLKSTSKQMERELGLTGPQQMVMRFLGRFPGLTLGQLAQFLYVHPSTLTGVVKRLEARGYLERKADPLDGRKAHLTLTGAGRALDVPASATVEAAVKRVLGRVPDASLLGAQNALRTLAEELGVG